ncbi:hypothetical protein Q8F55_003865 [Vanrija albida]|uniref:RING-type domain-containing protein n=1 Tax=Vanrija albida TaxID=181172 RepID=A0ABR3Q5D4_9TREE
MNDPGDGRGHNRERSGQGIPRKTRKKPRQRDGPVPEPYLALAPRPVLSAPPDPDPVAASLILPSTYVRRTRGGSRPSSGAGLGRAPSPARPLVGGSGGAYAANLLAPPSIVPRRGSAAQTQTQTRREGYAANWASPPAIMPGGSAASSSMQTGRSVPRPGVPGQQRRRGRVVNQEGSSLARRLTVTSREEGRAIGLSRGASMRRVNLWDDLPETDEAPPPFPFPTASNTRLPPTFEPSEGDEEEEGARPRSPPPRFDDLFPRRHSTGEALAPPRPPLRLTHSDVVTPVVESDAATQAFVSAPSSPIASEDEASTAHSEHYDDDERDDRRMWNYDISAGYSLEERVRREAVRQAARAKALASGASHQVAQMVAQAATPLPSPEAELSAAAAAAEAAQAEAARVEAARAEAARAEAARVAAARAEAARVQAARAEAARAEAARIEAARAEAARAEAAREEAERAEAAAEAARAEAARVAAEAARAEADRLKRVRLEAEAALTSKAEAKKAKAAQSEARRHAEKTEAAHRHLMAEAATRRYQAEVAATRRAEAQQASRRRDIEAAVRNIVGSRRVAESDIDAACDDAYEALKGRTPTADELVAAAKDAVDARIPRRTPTASIDDVRRRSTGEPTPRPGSSNGQPQPQHQTRSTPSPVNAVIDPRRNTPSPLDSSQSSERVVSPRPPSVQESRASMGSNRRASRIQLIHGNLVEVPLDLSDPPSRDSTPSPNPSAGTIPWPQPYSPPSRPKTSSITSDSGRGRTTSDDGRRRSNGGPSEAENITQTPITSSPRSSFSIPTDSMPEPQTILSQFRERSGSGGGQRHDRPGAGRSTSASTIDTIPEHVVFPTAQAAPVAEDRTPPAAATTREERRLSRGVAVRRSSASPSGRSRRLSLPQSKPDLPPLFTSPGVFSEELPADGSTEATPPRPAAPRSKTADEVARVEASPHVPHRHSIDASPSPSPATSNEVSAAALHKPLPSLPPGREAALRRRELGAPIQLEDTTSPPPVVAPLETPPLTGPLLDLARLTPSIPPAKSPGLKDLGMTAPELLELLEEDGAGGAESSARGAARAAIRKQFEEQLQEQSAIEHQVELDLQHALALETPPQIREPVVERLEFPPLPSKRPPVPPRPRVTIQQAPQPPAVPPPPARLAPRPARPLSDIGMPTPAVDTAPEIPRPQSSVEVHHAVSDDEDEADEAEFEYTDLDLFASQLEGTGHEYEGLTHLTQFMGAATDPGASAAALDTLIHAPVTIDSKRTNAKGKVKLKMSVLGARVTTCPICLAQFRGGDSAVCLPRCGHVSHETCATRWFKESSNCMICRLPLVEETLI